MNVYINGIVHTLEDEPFLINSLPLTISLPRVSISFEARGFCNVQLV